MTTLSKTSAIVAAAGLAFAPIAAQAGTRAESSPVAVDLQRGSAPVSEANEILGIDDALFVILLLLLGGALALIVSRSRG